MKLLKYITQRYIFYAILILLIAVPFFYFSIQYLLLNSQDENMQDQKLWIENKLKTTTPNNFISFENNVVVKPSGNYKIFDHFFNEPVFIPEDHETVMHRVLLANVLVNGKPYEIRIQKSMIEDEDLLNSILGLQLLLVTLLLVGLVMINIRISKRIWKPFNSIVQKMDQYRVDHPDNEAFIPTNISEFKELGTSIKNLTERNSKLYKAQKEFTENASHELQTPIAVMQSKVELLMQTTPLSQEQTELISEISHGGRRMQRLNRALLLLSKIENNQFPEIEKVNIIEVTRKLSLQYEEAAQEKNIEISTEFLNEIELIANPILIDILLGNLLSNAVRHSKNQHKIFIKTSGHTLSISNPATEKLNEAELFQRFKKQSNNSGSIGLGLEMSRKICDLYDYTIHYNFSGNYHHFSINF